MPFDIQLQDVAQVVSGQLSKIDLQPNFTNSEKVKVSDMIMTSVYDGSKRVIDPP